jgi:hypothetical protein
MKVTMTLTIDGTAQATREFDLSPKDARHLGDHLITHALAKVNAMAPDSDAAAAGARSVGFAWTYDNNGLTASVNCVWAGLDDVGVQAAQGVFDGAMAKLDHRIAAHEKGHGKP